MADKFEFVVNVYKIMTSGGAPLVMGASVEMLEGFRPRLVVINNGPHGC